MGQDWVSVVFLWVQAARKLNGLAGFYEPFRHTLNSFVGLSPKDQMPVTSVIAGAGSGAIGGMLVYYSTRPLLQSCDII